MGWPSPLGDQLAKALKRSVHIVIVSAYNDVRAGLERQEYDLAFIHPAHVSLAAIKSGKYRSVAWTVGYTDYAVSLLIDKDKPYTKLDDLKGRTVVSPDPDSITAAMLRAMPPAQRKLALQQPELRRRLVEAAFMTAAALPDHLRRARSQATGPVSTQQH